MTDLPVFLSVDNVLYLHADSIKKEGGCEGLRDLPLLESAVMMPQQRVGGEYLHRGIPTMAAAYLFHIVSNHPFLDGNKRAGAIAAFVFLDANGHDLTATEEEFEQVVVHVASSSISKDSLIDWFHSHTRARV